MIERESQQHEWTFFRQHSSGNTTDAYDYCSRCGAIRARYFWKDKDGGVSHQADPQYFGVGIEDHTTNQPLCLALLAPEPEPSDADGLERAIDKTRTAMESVRQSTYGPAPEPTDADVDAGARALWTFTLGERPALVANPDFDNASERAKSLYRGQAKAVLAAARAARQTGGEG